MTARPAAGRPAGARRRRAAAAGLVLAALAATGCAGGAPRDGLAERCIQALRSWTRAGGEPEILEIETDPGARRVAIRYAAGWWLEETEGRITCEGDPDDPWRFAHIAIGGRELSPVALLVVNGDLFLWDLAEHPERLQGP